MIQVKAPQCVLRMLSALRFSRFFLLLLGKLRITKEELGEKGFRTAATAVPRRLMARRLCRNGERKSLAFPTRLSNRS